MSHTSIDLAEYLPVLSVVLIDRRNGRQAVLVGIRNEAVNVNHPNVVSVPTMRLPLDLASAVLAQVEEQRLPSSIIQPQIAHDPLGYSIWTLLAAKVGLADAIERQAFDVSPKVGCLLQGESLIGYENGEDITEKLTMINVLCVVDRGHDEVPHRNAVFSHFEWLDYDELVGAAATKDLSDLNDPFTAPEVCIHGLCIKTAVALHSPWRALREASLV